MNNLTKFKYKDVSFNILDPSIITINEEGKWIEIEIPEIDIISGGETMEEAIEDFQEDVYFTWKTLVDSDINNLSKGAKHVRERFKELVRVEDKSARILGN